MYQLDTDRVIYILKGDPAVTEHLKRHFHDPMKISVVTYMELYYGAYKSQRVTANAARALATNNTDHFSRIDGLRLENWTVSHR